MMEKKEKGVQAQGEITRGEKSGGILLWSLILDSVPVCKGLYLNCATLA